MLGDLQTCRALMIVYGDFERLESAAEVHACVGRALQHLRRIPMGIDRHAALVGTFILAAELVQGIADAELVAQGHDLRSAAQEAGAKLLLVLAETIDMSWRSGFQAIMDANNLSRVLQDIDFDGPIKTRTGEGFAHYALYPESYLETARGSGLAENTCVIGIRSIGIGLAALVAAALHAEAAISVRPTGHPFDRQIRADSNLVGKKAAEPKVKFAIVDEGPGLSGSSFASVARWLMGRGVEAHRIHFFPGHDGQPGPNASPEIRAIWDAVTRHPASRHDVVLHPRGLRHWVEDKMGPLEGPLRDIACNADARLRPVPQDGRFTRPKMIARTADGSWLVKFAGLGGIGERRFRDAMALAASGFGPETVALCHGFIVQKWVEGRPLDELNSDRNAFLKMLGAYLAFRSRHLGLPGPGASLGDLRGMAVHNASQALGAEAAAVLDCRLAGLEALEHRVRPIRTDNRLHAWEWLQTENGVLKLDGIDQCEAHDLIGCQDIAWDIAGAIVEHGLDQQEVADLSRMVSEIGSLDPDPELIAALTPCYLAFQLGLWSTATPVRPEAEALAESYAAKLALFLRTDKPAVLSIAG
jgi:hypothetical protein